MSSATRGRRLRTRLALLYGGLFFASGAALVAFVDAAVLGGGSTRSTRPVPPGAGPPTTSRALSQPHGVNLHHVILYSALVLVLLLALSAVAGWRHAGRALQPLRTIIGTARDISARNLHARLGIEGPYDEFTELGETLDDLFGRLQASFDSQRRFVANASHELRTPLTAERALLQVALADPAAGRESLRSTCQDLLALNQDQERLIEALLTLASSEGGVERWERCDLADMVGKGVLVRHQDALRRGIRVDATCESALVVGDPNLIDSLVSNLVDNALRHNVSDGRCHIATASAGGRSCISVRNTGPLIPPDQVARLFEPFQRLGAGRIGHGDGHGVGLAIVRAIADAHGAQVSAEALPGGGLAVRVSFPAAA